MIMKNVLILIAFSAITAVAQDKKVETEKPWPCPKPYKCIEINYEAGVLSESIPIDQPIIISGQNTAQIENGRFDIYEKTKYKDIKVYPRDGKDDNELRFDSEKKKFYLTVNRILRANKEYRIQFYTSPPKAVIAEANAKIIKFYLDSKLNQDSATDIELLRLKDSLMAKIDNKYIAKKSFLDPSKTYKFTKEDVEFRDKISSVDRVLEGIKNDAGAATKTVRTLLNDKNIETIKKLNGDDIAKNLQTFTRSNTELVNVVKGITTLTNLTDKVPEISFENLDVGQAEASAKNIASTIRIIEGWKLSFDSTNRKKIELLKSQLENVEVSYISLKNGVIKDFIDAESALTELSFKKQAEGLFIRTTVSADVLTAAQAHVSADIGAMFTQLYTTPDSYRVLPYLRLNLYLSPVNKSTPFRALWEEYKFKTLLKILSIHAGVTLTKINNSTQYQGIYGTEDQRGFIAGIGIRPYRGIRFSYGYLFLNNANGNALNPTSQNISKHPYFSISLDWDVRSIIPDIRNLFTTK